MDLERSLANIKIDENPWRTQHGETPQPWAPMPGANNQPWGGGHMSPQQMRNPWPETNLAQNVNEALGIGGPGVQPGTWGAPMAGPGEFADPAKIWSDGNHEQPQFQPMHNHHMPGGINGMMDPSVGDWMGPSQSQQMWSDPIKQEQELWKHQQFQGGWNGPPNNMGGGQGFRMPHQHRGPRGGPHPPMGMQVPMRVGPPGAWNPGNMYPPVRQQGPSDHGGWNRGMARGGMGGGRGYPGVDMSVPPPIDMPINMRQMPPAGNLWKQDQMGAPNGMRPNPYGQMTPFGMPSKPQGPGQFPIAGADDLMWHDPNGDLKKWQRDTGVSFWGDPEKCNERPIRNWIVGEGEEEDLEQALSKCPVPQKRNDDGSTRLSFNLPSKRAIVVTGWGELPENDPNNPVKPEDMPSSSKWGEMTPIPYNDAPWNLPGQQPAPFVPEGGAWGQPPGGNMIPMHSTGLGTDPQSTAQKAEQLRYACEKGYIDMSCLSACLDMAIQPNSNLPPTVLDDIRTLLDKIPQLESVEQEMSQLVESVRPEGEADGGSPPKWMNEVQKVEYDRLIIAVTTAKIEVTNLSKKINGFLAESGMGSQEGARGGDGYRYPFIE